MQAETPTDQKPTSLADLFSNEHLEATLLRLGLLSTGAYLLHLVSIVAIPPVMYRAWGNIILLLLCGLMGFLLIAFAAVRLTSFTRWFILLACILGTGVLAVKWAQTSYASDLAKADTALYMDFSAKLLLEGKNPYDWDYAGLLGLYRTSEFASTPRLDGVMAISSYPYPALSFLLLIPFQVLHLPGAFLISFVVLIALQIVIFVIAPRSIQPLILLPLIAGLDFSEHVPIGSMDVVWALFLACMILAWEKPGWRAVLYGLAIAFKQSAWLVAPFLLIKLWLDRQDAAPSPFHRIAKFLAISGGFFLLTNISFVIWDPAAWFRGVAVNVEESLVIFSQGGLASLTQFGFISLPKNFYMIVMLAVFGLLLFAYWRHYDLLRDAFWFMPGIFLWVTYRCVNPYWLYWVFPATAVALRSLDKSKQHSLPVMNRSWKLTLLVSLTVLVLVAVAGIVLAQTHPTVVIEPQYPLFTSNGYVNNITVVLANDSNEVMTPRFSVQHQNQLLNPLSWHIDEGPSTLGPGQSATYKISTNKNTFGFLFHEDAQVVATDASGNYGLRAVARLQPDFTYLWPEAITNPDFRFWDTDDNAPSFWPLLSEPPGSGRVTPDYKDGRVSLKVTLDTSSPGYKWTALQNLITYQHKAFGIWLYVDPALENRSDVAYGLEFDDGEHRLWLLFGAEEYGGSVPDGVRIVQRSTPVGTWVYQEIDLPALYAEVGWEPPPFKLAVFRGLDADFQLLWLSLMVATTAETGEEISAYFGPFEQDYHVTPQLRMAQALDDPAAYYIRSAQTHIRDRNYLRALEAYQQALKFSPDSAEALEGVEQVRQHLDKGWGR
jgi:uncharacterized membrane protein